MYKAAQTTGFSYGAFGSDWAPTLDRIIAEAEAAEQALIAHAPRTVSEGRKASGSFYTPADVADHVWDQFFHLNGTAYTDGLRRTIEDSRFVEPSAGSGMFLFTLLRRLLRAGLGIDILTSIRFTVVDLNFAALRFIGTKIAEIELELGVSLSGIVIVQDDFLNWAVATAHDDVVFIGNPPFVKNSKGEKWRNLYASFIEAMLDYRGRRTSIGLILPLSICFSRDYLPLRRRLLQSEMDVQASSYDNIPDCLFEAGKPESGNSNKANSQRCTILIISGSSGRRLSASLRRWSKAARPSVLGNLPTYHDFGGYDHDGQIPRPSCDGILEYLAGSSSLPRLGMLLSRTARPAFAVGAVARNFIGIREFEQGSTSTVPIAAETVDDEGVLLQIICSPIFYEYWRSVGDGFHVTKQLIASFPIRAALMAICRANVAAAGRVWDGRQAYSREKLNAGKLVRSYDFRDAFGSLGLETL